MEIIIGAVVIIILLLVLGVSPILIIQGAVSLIEIFFILMVLFFIVSLILLLMTKPAKAKYLRIDQNEGVGTHAVYWMDEQEYDNSFPAEIMFIDKIYHKDQMYRVHIWKSKKNPERYLMFDWYSVIVIAVGLPVFGALAAVGGWFWTMLI